MSEDFRSEVRASLAQKDLYALLDIWKSNDHVQWTDTTFEVLAEILRERIGELPLQDPPVHAYEGNEQDEPLEDWERKLLDSESQPELYDPLDVLSLRDKIHAVIVGSVVAYILLALLNLQVFRGLFNGATPSLAGSASLLPNMAITVISTAVQIALIYVPLRVLESILRILMEMEFNSRKVPQTIRATSID